MEERAAAARALASDAVLALQPELLWEDGDHALSTRVLRFLCPRFVYCTALLFPRASDLALFNRDHLNRTKTPVYDQDDLSHAFGVVTHAWVDDDGDGGLKINFKLLVDSTKSHALVQDVRAGQKSAVSIGQNVGASIVNNYQVLLGRWSWCGGRMLSISQ